MNFPTLPPDPQRLQALLPAVRLSGGLLHRFGQRLSSSVGGHANCLIAAPQSILHHRLILRPAQDETNAGVVIGMALVLADSVEWPESHDLWPFIEPAMRRFRNQFSWYWKPLRSLNGEQRPGAVAVVRRP